MKHNLFKLMSAIIVLSMALAACGGPATVEPTAVPTAAPATKAPATAVPATAAPTQPPAPTGKVCEVTDVGGVDDKSFNQTAWAGAQDGAAKANWEATVLESQQQTDYEKNINEFVQSGCDLIVTVGFLLGDATAAAAKANPDQQFMILDYAYSDPYDNIWQQVYATDQGAFLAGYVAASATKTGKVGTFGGINIPPVVDFMVGFENGVAYYNQKHSTEVVVLGWSTEAADGLFTGNFDSTDDGRRFAESLMDEGADVIMPVAGPVGLGSAAAVQERGNAWIVGVDTDWRVSASEYKDIILTSVLKKLEVSVAQAVEATAGGKFAGGLQVATLENGGIGITTDGAQISDATRAELEPIIADIIGGTIATTGAPTNSAKGGKVCEVTDVGGVDDKSFNQTAWNGAVKGAAQAGWEAVVLESQQQTDYEKNINEFLQSDCDLIVTVGFLLGDATAAAATANPDQQFMILDYAYSDPYDNVWQQVYATDQGAFLAGYVAASATKTGKVGTFGGINIPPVVDFMDGFAFGVAYYNEKNGTSVEVLGWNPEDREGGLFTGNFDSTDDGRRMAETLMDEGADIIMPVAGPVGLGTAAAVKERGNAWIIGVDTDWTVSASDYADITLTSVIKKLDATVAQAIRATAGGKFAAGVQVATLENGGVGIADFHDLASMVPDQAKDDLAKIITGIIAGEIKTKP